MEQYGYKTVQILCMCRMCNIHHVCSVCSFPWDGLSLSFFSGFSPAICHMLPGTSRTPPPFYSLVKSRPVDSVPALCDLFVCFSGVLSVIQKHVTESFA